MQKRLNRSPSQWYKQMKLSCNFFSLFNFCRFLEGKEEGKGSDEEDDKKSKQGNFGPRKKFQWNDNIRFVSFHKYHHPIKGQRASRSRVEIEIPCGYQI